MTHATSLMISEPRYSMLLRIWERRSLSLTDLWIEQHQKTLFNKDITSKCNNVSTPHKIFFFYLCCHDEARGSGVDGDVTCHQSYILKLFVHLSVLLVGESLDGAGEDHSLLLPESQRNSISAERYQRKLLKNVSKELWTPTEHNCWPVFMF